MRSNKSLLFIVLGLMPVMAATTFPTTRDPLKWPFAQNSIWNTPIGSNAVYVSAGITGTGWLYCDDDIIILAPTAPLTNLETNTEGWSGNSRCADMGANLGQLRIPTDLLIPHLSGTPNMACAVLKSDGLTIHQSQPFHRCVAGSYATSQYIYPEDNIKTGNGIQGAHGGSGMSSLGGTIRMGELVPGGVIRHVLKIGLYANSYLNYASDGTRGYRWPAVKADGYAADQYRGPNAQFEMGALLALKTDFNVDALLTEPGKIFAQACKDYGAYVTDDTYWDATQIMTEWGNFGKVEDEFQSVWGYSFGGDENSSNWNRDMNTIVKALHIITNNSSSNMGGGGTRRAPLAPAFIGESTPVLADYGPQAKAYELFQITRSGKATILTFNNQAKHSIQIVNALGTVLLKTTAVKQFSMPSGLSDVQNILFVKVDNDAARRVTFF